MATATDNAANNSVAAAAKPAPPAKQVRVVQDSGPLAHLLDTARFEHLQRIALIMATASLIPDHLRGKSQQETLGNCFLVVNQSLRWGLDPFAVAAETYSVQGKLGFQGKLIAALVNARANLDGKLRYEFKGKGDDRTVTVIGRFEDEDSERTVDLSVGQAKTSNKMWSTDPDQKLIYSAATKWARRHCPEVLLGVLTDDDVERMAESRSIVEGPTQDAEPRSLADLTAKLAPAGLDQSAEQVEAAATNEATTTTETTAPAESAATPAHEAAAAVETTEPAFDFDAFATELAGHLSAATDLKAVEGVRKWALGKVPADGDLVLRAHNLCDERAKALKGPRGEASNGA